MDENKPLARDKHDRPYSTGRVPESVTNVEIASPYSDECNGVLLLKGAKHGCYHFFQSRVCDQVQHPRLGHGRHRYHRSMRLVFVVMCLAHREGYAVQEFDFVW